MSFCVMIQVDRPNPPKSAQQQHSKSSLAERADFRYPHSDLKKALPEGAASPPNLFCHAWQREAALSEGACDGHPCKVPSVGPLRGRNRIVGLSTYQGGYPAPSKFRGLIFQMRVALGRSPESGMDGQIQVLHDSPPLIPELRSGVVTMRQGKGRRKSLWD